MSRTPGTTQHIRILIVEDNPLDAELVQRELRRAALDYSSTIVDEETAFRAAIESSDPDVILADYNLPRFDGQQALKIACDLAPSIPFIFVSGSIGEERAVQALREGATDYVLKDRLSRLAPAITRALSERRERVLRQRMQEALSRSERRFQHAVEATQEVIWDWDLQSRKLWFSRALRDFWGYDLADDLVDAEWFEERIHPEDRDRVIASFEQAAGSDSRWNAEFRFRRADGSYGDVLARGVSMHGGDVRDHVIVAMLDISQQKVVEEKLRQSVIRFRSVAETAPDAIILTRASGEIGFWNDGATTMFGYTAAEADGQNISILLPRKERTELVALVRDALGSRGVLQIRGRRKDGHHFPAELAVSRWESQGEQFFTVIARDASAFTEAERLQRLQFVIARTLTDAAGDRDIMAELLEAIGTTLDCAFGSYAAPSGSLVQWRPGDARRNALSGLHSLAPTVFASKSALVEEVGAVPRGSADDSSAVRARIHHRLAFPIIENGRATGVFEFASAEHVIDQQALLDALNDAGRRIGEMFQRRRAEERLHRSEASLAEAQRIANLGNWSLELRSGRMSWSDELYRIMGLPLGDDDMTYERAMSMVHPADADRVRRRSTPPLMKADDEFDFTVLPPAGGEKTLHVHVRLAEGTLENPVKIIGTAQDITERLHLERRVEQAKRITSLGRVAATIAHEFNNVLMGIQPFAEIIRRQAGGDEKIGRAADQIIASVARGRRVTQEILRFTQPAEPALTAVDIREWLDSILVELRALVGERVKIDVRNDEPSPVVRIDTAQMQQVITNLVVNARDAMEGVGNIEIAAEIDRSADTPLCRLAVSDNGPGMSPAVLQSVFEPLFTTKRSGTGLGLAVVQQIITRHGGSIHVHSDLGKGSVFTILLPVADDVSAGVPKRTHSTAPEISGRRLLIVDDDAAVTDGIAALMRMEGFVVQSVDTGGAAETAIASFSPDAVILDLSLPDISGDELYVQLKERWPHLPVIFATGHGEASAIRDVAFLRKPYDLSALIDAIAAVTRPNQ